MLMAEGGWWSHERRKRLEPLRSLRPPAEQRELNRQARQPDEAAGCCFAIR